MREESLPFPEGVEGLKKGKGKAKKKHGRHNECKKPVLSAASFEGNIGLSYVPNIKLKRLKRVKYRFVVMQQKPFFKHSG